MIVDLPTKFKPLFEKHRFKILKGGRSSAKSRSWATAIVTRVRTKYEFVVCTRELQKSITDSSKRLIENEIKRQNVSHLFHITISKITYIPNGSEFVFYGLKSNPESIKSLEGATICIIEEANNVSQNSLDILFPTIREEESEIWIVFNPKFKNDPVYEMFILNEPPPETIIITANYYDNPFLPDVIRKHIEWMKVHDYDKYKHIYLGQILEHSKDQVFYGKWEIRDFEAPEDQEVFYYGADWGFSEDPCTLHRCWIDEEENELMIDYEEYGYKRDLPDLPAMYDKIPGSRKYTIRADNSRPETIKYVANKGFDVIGATKGPGSIEDGIEFMKSFNKIVVHTRCPEIAYEFSEYKFKTDPKTGDILPIIIDKNNHGIDGIRYATRPLHSGQSDWDTEVRTG